MILKKEPATACTGWLKRENVAKQPFLGLKALGMKNQQEKVTQNCTLLVNLGPRLDICLM